MGKAAIVNPYLDTLGGGERYTLSFAKVLSDNGWAVDIEWKDSTIKKKLESRFGINIENVKFIPDVKRGDGYDLCFWVSDGSIPALRARKNFIHFQVPFHGVKGSSLMNKMKLFRISKIICNSKFTKKFIDQEYGVNSVVIYPPVATNEIKPKRKENLIIYVARFSQILQNKNQDTLIKAFKKLNVPGWKLVMAGGVEVGVGDYLNKLKKMSAGYPIEFIESPDFKTLRDVYGRAKFFWSAAGYNENENKNPEKVEHFGISVVESMAAGGVPIIYSAGGYTEIVSSGQTGYLWKKESELLKYTRNLIANKAACRLMSANCISESQKYSYSEFSRSVIDLL